MGLRGPKPTPIALANARGNPGKRNLEKKALHAPLGEPDAPPGLGVAAREEWDRIMPLLMQIKMMTEIDRALLTSYCRAWGRFMEAEAEMTAEASRRGEAHCLLVENKTGEMVVNPLVAVSFKAMEAIHKYAKEFGMTPSARMNVRPSEAASDGNPFDAFRKTGT